MKEKIFNIFLYVNSSDRVIFELGAVRYARKGTDEEKTSYLQERAWSDFKTARRFKLPSRCIVVRPDGTSKRRQLTYDTFLDYMRANRHMQFIEEIFRVMGGPANPIICITTIVDGSPRVEAIADFPTLQAHQ